METSEYQQQAIDFAKNHKIKLYILEDPQYKKYFPGDKEERYVFKLMLERFAKQYTFTFGQSIQAGAKEPTMYDILTCLTKYDPGTFENFCGDFGYDEDSRSAEKTYNACIKEYEAVQRLFGDILEELQEIQ